MKIKHLSLPLLLGVSIASITFAGIQNKKEAKEAYAANDTTSLYQGCESAIQEKSLSKLWSNVKTAANTGFKTGSYAALWNWYWTTDVKPDGTLMDYYSNATKYSSKDSQCGGYSGEGDCYNREHTIPKSWWGGSTSNQGCDIYIVIPTDGYVNNRRSAYPLGETNGEEYTSKNGFSKLGSNTFSGYNGKVFEPNDQFKGDIARLHFYSRAKWTNVAMTSSEGDSTFSGSESSNYGLTSYGVNLFYKWHKQDPVDDWELQRNDRGQSVQGNRNPFIDHPEYVDYLWGGVEIGSESGSQTAPTSLTINGNSKVAVGATAQLSVSVSPSDASKSVTWSTSSSSIATVSSTGLVTGVSKGNVTITATSKVDSSIKATKSIQVIGMSNLTYTGTPKRTTYESKDSFEPAGLTVTATYSDGSTVDVTNDVKWGSLVAGQTSVQGSYGGYTITVTGLTITQSTVQEDASVVFDFSNNSSDVTTSSSIDSINNGTDANNDLIESVTSATKTYQGGSNGLRLASGSNAGNITFNIKYAKQAGVKAISVTTKNYDSGATLQVQANDTTTIFSSLAADKSQTYTFTNATNVSKIKFSASKRIYVKSFTFTYEGGLASTDTITLDKSSATLFTNETLLLTATASGDVTWSSSNTSIATVANGLVTPVSTGSVTITATCGSAIATCTVTVTQPQLTLDESSLTLLVGDEAQLTAINATGTVTWTSSNSNVATVSQDGDITAVGAGTCTITASAGGQTAICEIKVKNSGSTSINNSIEEVYNGTENETYTIYGVYVAYSYGSGPVLMNGEFGMLLYQFSNYTSWKENETVVKITGTRATYSGLVELKNCTNAEVIEDQGVIDNNVEPIVAYRVSGAETSSDATLANRLSIVTCTIANVEAGSKTNEYNVTATLSGNNIYIFLKNGSYSSDDLSKIVEGATLTIQGVTSIHNTTFEIMFKKIIEADDTYTALMFASDLLELTDTACTASKNNNWANVKSLLSNTWITLEGEDYYAKLPAAQKEILAQANADDNGSTIEQAMARYDHIVARYQLNNFIEGRSVPSLVRVNPIFTDETSIISIIVIISLISVTAIGAFFYIRKKKEIE